MLIFAFCSILALCAILLGFHAILTDEEEKRASVVTTERADMRHKNQGF